MRGKTRIAFIALVVAFGFLGLRWLYHSMIFDQGRVSSVVDLQRVFAKVGPPMAFIFTNSLLQKFPFKGDIEWRRGFIKDPMLSVDGNVDTNLLRGFVGANPGVQFIWSGVDTNGKEWVADEWPTNEEYPSVYWRSMRFGTPHTNPATAVIDGTLDIVSNRVHFLIH